MKSTNTTHYEIQSDCHPGSLLTGVSLGFARKDNEQAVRIGRIAAGDPGQKPSGMTPNLNVGQVLPDNRKNLVKNDNCVEDPRLQASGMTTNLNVGQAMPDNQIKCHSKLDLESHRMLLRNNEILNQVQDDRRGGFTLIELLVVVLIIGILAAVALPQYQKAVERSHAAAVSLQLKSINEAAQLYYLTHGTWSTNLNNLDITIDTHLTSNWTFSFASDGKAKGIKVVLTTGKYSSAALYMYNLYGWSSSMPINEIVCAEPISQFSGTRKGSYCKKILGGTLIITTAYIYYYRLPQK